MGAKRSNYFFESGTTLTGDFKDNAFEWDFSSRHLKLAVEGANLEYALVGPNNAKVDGIIKPSDGLVNLDGLEANRIALRQAGGSVSEWRVIAYK